MFIGHGLVAFAIAASVAAHRGWPSERALTVGVVAGLFATLPDLDMAYALLGLFSGAEGLIAASDAFWDAAARVHRSVTHSLVLGGLAAVGFTAWRARDRRRWLGALGAAVLGGLVAVVWAVDGLVGAAIVALLVVVGLGVVRLARSAGFGPAVVLGAALLGLLTHPFGDLLTGQPPALLYPFETVLLTERVTLHPDPTLNLLGAFFVELSTLWLALLVVARLRAWRLRPLVRPRAALGVGYAGAVVVIPAPTLTLSWPFVFSVLAVGAIAVPVARNQWPTPWRTATTALTAVTLAALAYTAAYLVV